MLCLTGFLTGPLFDLGYAYPMIYIGSFLVVFGMFMTSLCTQYWQFILAQGVCIGVGSGCLFIPSVGIIPTYFTTKKALATGIAASGSSIAGIIYPIAFSRLQPLIGFPWATRAIAFIMLFTLSISIITFRVRVLPSERRRLYDPKALMDVPFVLFNMTAFLVSMGLYIPYFYIATYSSSKTSMPPSLAFYTIPILGAGSAVGRILPNFYADKAGSLNMLTICTSIATVLAFCWLAIANIPGIIVFCVLYGFFSGTFVSLQPTSVVTLSPSLGVFGTRMGMNVLSCGLGTLVGTPVAGVIVRKGDWVGLVSFCSCALALGSLLVVAAKLMKNRGLMARV